MTSIAKFLFLLIPAYLISCRQQPDYPAGGFAYPPKIADSDSIIQGINASGFWTMPYQIKCDRRWMDAPGFHFEANTRTRYQIVQVHGCPDDTTKFTAACQKIVEMAKMQKKVHLTWSGKTVTVDSVELQEIKPLRNPRRK